MPCFLLCIARIKLQLSLHIHTWNETNFVENNEMENKIVNQISMILSGRSWIICSDNREYNFVK